MPRAPVLDPAFSFELYGALWLACGKAFEAFAGL